MVNRFGRRWEAKEERKKRKAVRGGEPEDLRRGGERVRSGEDKRK